MMRLLWAVVSILGVTSLVFGIVFIVMGSSAKTEVIDHLKEEGFPILSTNIGTDNEAYPYLTLALLNDPTLDITNIIDTTEEIDEASDIVKACRHEMIGSPAGIDGFGNLFTESTFIPLELPTEAGGNMMAIDTITLHEYTGLQSLENVLNLSKVGLGVSNLMIFIGIVNIIIGIALTLVGGIGIARRLA